jgi:8-oxo-dGTP pyrophosphatase MutT (NUDIX family)
MAGPMTDSDAEAAPPIRTLSSSVVLQTPYFAIEEDRVRADSGDGTYWVMRRKPFAAAVVTDTAGNILCVRNWRYPICDSRWEIPQGNAESTDLQEVARQELLEEAGVTVSDLELVGLLHEAYGYSDGRCEVYAGAALSQQAARPEPLEAIDATKWFTPEHFWTAVDDGSITDAVTVAAVALWERKSRRSR